MSAIILELPTMQHEIAANQFKEEFFNNQEQIINGSALFDQMEFKQWLDFNKKNSSAATVSDIWVVATTFFAVRKSDNKIVGMIDIRHSLENEFLAVYGGHIGYAIRPSERKKGYATQMLVMALEYAASINLSKVMLACYADNTASLKTITKCGGVFSESKKYMDGKSINIYWIDLSGCKQ